MGDVEDFIGGDSDVVDVVINTSDDAPPCAADVVQALESEEIDSDGKILQKLPSALQDLTDMSLSCAARQYRYQTIETSEDVTAQRKLVNDHLTCSRHLVEQPLQQQAEQCPSSAPPAPAIEEVPVTHPHTVQLEHNVFDRESIDRGLASACAVYARLKNGPEYCLVVEFKGMSTDAANALRIIIDAYTPTHRFEEMKVLYNDSNTLLEQDLALNLGLLPLIVKPELLLYRGELQWNTDSSGSSATAIPTDTEFAEDSVSSSLSAIPTFYTDHDLQRKWNSRYSCMTNVDTLVYEIDVCASHGKPRAILSGDLRWIPQEGQTVVSAKLKPSGIYTETSPKGSRMMLRLPYPPIPVSPLIPLAYIAPNERFHALCMTRKGVARMHNKFQPAHVWYHQKPSPQLSEYASILPLRARQSVVDSCAAKIYRLDAKKRLCMVPDAGRACNMCMNCVTRKNGEIIEPPRNCVRFEFDLDTIMFYVETTDVTNPVVLIANAFAVARGMGNGEVVRVQNMINAVLKTA